MIEDDNTPELQQPKKDSQGISRRTIVKGAAWSVPVIAVAVPAPAYAAVSCTPEPGQVVVQPVIDPNTDILDGNNQEATSTWQVPAGVTSIRFEIAGGGGGGGATLPTAEGDMDLMWRGGHGHKLKGTMVVTPGDVLTFIAGAGGVASNNRGTNLSGGRGFGNGGRVGPPNAANVIGEDRRLLGGSGGGGSAILLNGAPAVVAGGGGGAGRRSGYAENFYLVQRSRGGDAGRVASLPGQTSAPGSYSTTHFDGDRGTNDRVWWHTDIETGETREDHRPDGSIVTVPVYTAQYPRVSEDEKDRRAQGGAGATGSTGGVNPDDDETVNISNVTDTSPGRDQADRYYLGNPGEDFGTGNHGGGNGGRGASAGSAYNPNNKGYGGMIVQDYGTANPISYQVTSGAGGGGYAGGASGNARRIMSDAVTTFDVDSTPPGEPYLLTDARGAGQKSDLPIRMFMAGGGGAGSSFIDTNRILLDPTDGSSSAGNGATTLDTRNGGSVTVDYTVPC